ncbi:hypothetical protein [Streptomyces beijiangensis]|uniref:Integral membrane protein n=1 Tax=Streptomyces beijiangensis TaxID=163361 RepID=A0A939F1U5_9ACTN|nr:hypothetical protein [Streptomyces beijiangensis]MBO0510283.1 hypothetical protein [Streptomyces beijiangensis]
MSASLSGPRAGTGLRLLRAAVFAAVCTVLSAAGHVLAADETVPWWTLAAGFLGMFAVAAPLAGRERSLPGIAAVLASGQLALHTLFGLGQHAMAPASTMVMPSNGSTSLASLAGKFLCGEGTRPLSAGQAQRLLEAAGLSHAQMAHLSMTDMTPSHQPGMGLLPTLPMLLGHLLAALACGWLMRRGEVALFRLARLSAQGVAEGALVRNLRAALALAHALRAGLPAAPPPGLRPGHAHVPVPLPLAGQALQHTVTRRGPPSASYDLAA